MTQEQFSQKSDQELKSTYAYLAQDYAIAYRNSPSAMAAFKIRQQLERVKAELTSRGYEVL